MNENLVFSKLLYPLVFEPEPMNVLDRVLVSVASTLDADERRLIVASVRDGRLHAGHPLVKTLGLAATEASLTRFLDTLASRWTNEGT